MLKVKRGRPPQKRLGQGDGLLNVKPNDESAAEFLSFELSFFTSIEQRLALGEVIPITQVGLIDSLLLIVITII